MIEKRMVDFEVRADNETPARLVGRAAVFDSETVIGGVFREVIRPGAFTKTLQERDIKMLWNHNTHYPMGSTKAGTLRLNETHQALEIDGDPPKEAPYSGFMENIRRGDVSQMSFGFEVVKENVVRKEGEMDLREVLEVKLYEVSPVTFPAYTDTEIQARAAEVAARWQDSDTETADAGRTTHEPGASVPHSAEPDGGDGRLLRLKRSKLKLKERKLCHG